MDSTHDVEDLLPRARNGDRKAWGELTARLRGPLEAHVRRRIGPHLRQEVDPEDVLQESLAQATRSLRHFQGASARAFIAWLRGIAEHVILNCVRRKRTDRIIYVEHDAASSDPSPTKRQQRGERMDRLERAFESLRPEHREILRLVRIEGLSVGDAARRMGRTSKAAVHLLGRALAKLKEAFGDTESFSLPRDRRIDGGQGHGA